MRKALPFFSLTALLFVSLIFSALPLQADPPEPVEGIRLHATITNVNGTVRLNWMPLVNTPFNMYFVYRSGGSPADSSDFTLIDSTEELTFEDQLTILSASTSMVFRYYVVGRTIGGTTVNSNTVTVEIPGIPPDNAFRLRAEVEEDSTVQLKWDVPSIASDSLYSIFRVAMGDLWMTLSPLPHGDTVMVATTTATSYTDVPPLTVVGINTFAYFIKVRAKSGIMLQSSVALVALKKTVPPDTVTFTSTPITTARVGVEYVYDADAVSSDPTAIIRYSIENTMSSVFISINDSTGVVTLTPHARQYIPVHIVARSNKGGLAVQSFIITVSGTNGTVSGTVTDTLDRPIKGVMINLLNRNAYVAFSYKAFTDSLGKYRITGVDGGTYLVHAIPVGGDYFDQWFDGKSSAADATPIIIADSPSVAVADFKLRAKTSGKPTVFDVKGTVTDTLGLPIGGKDVRVYFVNQKFALNQSITRDYMDFDHDMDFRIIGHSHFVFMAKVDSLGAYSLKLPADNYIALAKAPGYQAIFFNNQTNFLQADVIALRGDTSGINFRLPPIPAVALGAISGQVLDTTQHVGVRARMIAFRGVLTFAVFRHFINTYFTETDTLGNYTFDNLPPGFYLVLAIPVGNYAPVFYQADASIYSNTWMWRRATPIAINGNSVSGINLFPRALPDSARGYTMIQGTVVESNAGNVPVDGAIVYASDPDGNVAGYSTTDSQGKFVIDELAPGTYSVSADVPGFDPMESVQAAPTYDAQGNAVAKTVTLNLESVTAIAPEPSTVPASYSLSQNYPNPFNPTTKIQFAIPARSKVSLKVYNLIGQEVATLVNGIYEAGTYTTEFNGSNLSTGVYFYRLQAGDFTSTRKLVLLK